MTAKQGKRDFSVGAGKVFETSDSFSKETEELASKMLKDVASCYEDKLSAQAEAELTREMERIEVDLKNGKAKKYDSADEIMEDLL